MPEANRSGEQQKLFDMIKDIKVAMMTTLDEDGSMRSRPMWSVQSKSDKDLWFFTRASAPKTGELQQNRKVNLAYSDPSGQNYVSVSGTAETVRDKAKIQELWAEPMRTWFPKGTDDPDIALIRVRVEQGEYWDSPSSMMVHAYGYAKAVLTGEPPKPGDNAKVDVR
jgi:general stress protein 26